MKRSIGTVAIFAVIFFASLSVLPALGVSKLFANMFQPAIIFILLLGEIRIAYAGGCIAGFLLDTVSPLPFGTHIVSYSLPLLATRWAFTTWITNRSAVALCTLTILATITIDSSLLVSSTLGQLLDPNSLALSLSREWLNATAFDAIRNVALALLTFLVIRLSGRSYAILASREF